MFGAFQTFGKLGAIGKAIAAAWSPLSLWPDGIASPGMWISPRTLSASFNDYLGTTPVSTPGTVADSSNPVGLALDLRLGAPTTLGPELVTNGDFSAGASGWDAGWTNFVDGKAVFDGANSDLAQGGVPVAAGKTYQMSWYQSEGAVYYRLGGSGNLGFMTGEGQKTAYVVSPGTSGFVLAQAGMTPGVGYIDNVSIREIPGNHMLQATSTARPLLSARVNFLQYTEDFGNASWERTGCTITANSTTAPDGTSTADSIVTAGGTPNMYQLSASLPATECTFSIYIKGTGNSIGKAITLMVWYFGTATGTNTFSGETISGDWQRFDIQSTPATAGTVIFRLLDIGNGALADGDVVYVWGAQAVIGPNAGTYVPVPGAPYPSTGLPVYQKYDGIDDGMATASFAAGTLSNNMDCLIAVRRDSAAWAPLGLAGDQDGIRFFGFVSVGDYLANYNCGTPTVWVDGIQVAGGTNVRQNVLNAAVSVGDFHILEFRGLDLSGWTRLFTGLGLPSPAFILNGAQGGILLFPGGNTAGRDAARAWLAAKVGVTLP